MPPPLPRVLLLLTVLLIRYSDFKMDIPPPPLGLDNASLWAMRLCSMMASPNKLKPAALIAVFRSTWPPCMRRSLFEPR